MRESDRSSEALKRCLVEEEGATLRSPRRRQVSLVLSVALQASVLATGLLVPLLMNGEKLQATILVPPRVPFRRGPSGPPQKQPPGSTQRPSRPQFDPNRIFQPPVIPPNVTDTSDAPMTDDQRGPGNNTPGDPNGLDRGFLPYLGPGRSGPPPVMPSQAPVAATPPRIRVTLIQPSQLIHRVQPVYPILARQTRLEGRVVLRAVIGRDGTVQELEVLSGHPWFVRASLDAVRQWRYRPTVLNGQAVEVETQITVIFVLRN